MLISIFLYFTDFLLTFVLEILFLTNRRIVDKETHLHVARSFSFIYIRTHDLSFIEKGAGVDGKCFSFFGMCVGLWCMFTFGRVGGGGGLVL